MQPLIIQVYIWISFYLRFFTLLAGVENLQRSSGQPYERLVSLGIMVEKLRASLKPLEHHGSVVPRGFRGLLSIGPPLCREELASPAADVFFPLWPVEKKNSTVEFLCIVITELYAVINFSYIGYMNVYEYKPFSYYIFL